MLLQSVNSCSNDQVIGYCNIFFKPFNSTIDMQSWTKMLRQIRETNAFEQTEFCIRMKTSFSSLVTDSPRNNVAKRRSWVQFPPWSEFFLSFYVISTGSCGACSVKNLGGPFSKSTRGKNGWVYFYCSQEKYSLFFTFNFNL